MVEIKTRDRSGCAVPSPSVTTTSTLQVCPPLEVLDRFELVRSGACDPTRLALPLDDEQRRAAEGVRTIEVVDPEGVPLARISSDHVAADGTLACEPTWLGSPSSRPYERLYVSPEAVRARAPEGSLTVVVDRVLTARDIDVLRRRANGKPVILLALTGPSASPYSRGVSVLRSCVAALPRLPQGHVVALPLGAQQATEDSELLAEVVAAYSTAEVARLDDTPGDLPDRSPGQARGNGGLVLFFTGLSGSGKSTVARAVREAVLEDDGRPVTTLDGDVVRRHLSAGLGFSPEDRETNILRIGWVAAEIAYQGGMAICSPIAPYARTRAAVRAMALDRGGDFVLVHVSTPLEVCEQRDRKGLYAKARQGTISNFTGISAPYEAPTDADLVLDTSAMSIEQARDRVLDLMRGRGHLISPDGPEWNI